MRCSPEPQICPVSNNSSAGDSITLCRGFVLGMLNTEQVLTPYLSTLNTRWNRLDLALWMLSGLCNYLSNSIDNFREEQNKCCCH